MEIKKNKLILIFNTKCAIILLLQHKYIKMLRYERIQKCYDTERIGNR